MSKSKHVLDAASVAVAGATFFEVVAGILPDIAAGLSVVWLALRIANEWHRWRTRKRL